MQRKQGRLVFSSLIVLLCLVVANGAAPQQKKLAGEKQGAAAGKKAAVAARKAEAQAKTQNRGEIMLRVRITDIKPDVYARIMWVWRRGVTIGDPVAGEITAVPPQAMPAQADIGDGKNFIVSEEQVRGGNKGEKTKALWVRKNVWLTPVPITHFKTGSWPFVKISVKGRSGPDEKRPVEIENVTLEFEISYDGKVVKTFSESATHGPCLGLYLPLRKLAPDGTPSPEFIDEVGGFLRYAEIRGKSLHDQPWIGRPLPVKYAIATDCFGYGEGGKGYGVQTSTRAVIDIETWIARQLGVNGLRAESEYTRGLIERGEGVGKELRRIKIGGAPGILVAGPGSKAEGAGCPWHPASIKDMTAKLEEHMANAIARTREFGTQEAWLLEQDEIDAFYTSHKKQEHMASCEHCNDAFRNFVKSRGYAPADFGVKEWKAVKTSHAILADLKAEGYAPPAKGKGKGRGKSARQPENTPAGEDKDEATNDGEVEAVEDDAEAGSLNGFKLPVSQGGWHAIRCLTRDFNCYTTAVLLEGQKKGFDAANEAKRKAIAGGKLETPEAKQPWMYAYALRRASWTQGGSALDYFDFYRRADNGFMYETSNRDPRAWPWDSYLCDVGRILTERYNTRFAVCIKPHRGAPIQRALAGVARNATAFYWYTFGPNWAKGDSFGGSLSALKQTALAARIIAAAEDVTYGSRRAIPAEVALVKMRTSESFENSTSWENGKWIYTALLNAHIPVDPLSETMLAEEDLARYKVIYACGPNLRKEVAAKLVKWVENGGILFTSGGGLARNEYNEPVPELQAMLGLAVRKPLEEWRKMPRYGATGLGTLSPYTKDKNAVIPTAAVQPVAPGLPPLEALQLGREVLAPADKTRVLAKFDDGAPAVTMNTFGKGKAFVVGFYAGGEYGAGVYQRVYDTAVNLKAENRAYLTLPLQQAGVRPVVEPQAAQVDGVLLKASAGEKHAVVLVNWSFQAYEDDHEGDIDYKVTKYDNFRVNIRGLKNVKRVYSCALDKDIQYQPSGEEGIAAVIPEFNAGDILIVE